MVYQREMSQSHHIEHNGSLILDMYYYDRLKAWRNGASDQGDVHGAISQFKSITDFSAQHILQFSDTSLHEPIGNPGLSWTRSYMKWIA